MVVIFIVTQILKMLAWAVTRYDFSAQAANSTVSASPEATVHTQYTFWSTLITVTAITVASAIVFKPQFLLNVCTIFYSWLLVDSCK